MEIGKELEIAPFFTRMFMKILGMGANPLNSRDGIIVEGCKAILNINQFDRYVFINDHYESHDIYPNEGFDLIVYCGTPFLWDGMQHTAKYKNTMRVINAHPEAKVVWLGIGSSLYLGDDTKTNILRHTEDQIMLQSTFLNSTVIVRDSLAHEILNKAGVENHFLPCPSYFFHPVCKTSKETDVIFYHAPETGISQGYWNDNNIQNYKNSFTEFFKRGGRNAIIAVCEPEEIQLAKDLFWEHPILLKDPIDTFNICKKARRVLSGRIHNAVPALVYGAEVGIVPVDSRHLTITNHFDIQVNNVTDLQKIRSYDINTLTKGNIEIYRDLIFKGLK